MFKLVSDFKPSGDQPEAIDSLVQGIKDGMHAQTLLGVTGSGKTFTMANIIDRVHTCPCTQQDAGRSALCRV